MELKKQTNIYSLTLTDYFSEIPVSEIVAVQGVGTADVIGRKVYQKYHNIRFHFTYGTAPEAFQGSVRIRVVVAWRQNKLGVDYAGVVGNTVGSLFSDTGDNNVRLITPYQTDNDGTWHVAFDKLYILNAYTKDSIIVNLFLDKNRPISLEPTGNPGELHDSNRQYTVTVLREGQPTSLISATVYSEIGYYDP